jgi:hypothetical protein
MFNELVNYVGEPIVANTSYGNSVHLQRRNTENQIQNSNFMIKI